MGRFHSNVAIHQPPLFLLDSPWLLLPKPEERGRCVLKVLKCFCPHSCGCLTYQGPVNAGAFPEADWERLFPPKTHTKRPTYARMLRFSAHQHTLNTETHLLLTSVSPDQRRAMLTRRVQGVWTLAPFWCFIQFMVISVFKAYINKIGQL